MTAPELNPADGALLVLDKIDEILHWEQTKDRERMSDRRVRTILVPKVASRPVLETRESEILRRVSAEALSRSRAERRILLDGHSREFDAIPKQRLERSVD